MKILVDADSCPVKDIIFEVAENFSIEVVVVKNLSHDIKNDYVRVITVDEGKDAVDFVILNNTQKNDLIITQDYGLASLVLTKYAKAIHPNGWVFTNNNIDGLLMNRHINQQIRKRDGKLTKVPKRKKEDNIKFKNLLEDTLTQILEK
ncbi:hypothetical protein CDO51_03380 [Natranaerobius trueperi]|uniref:UPF0178 protein CDO51_03380 n=1 Tax=Natranaerobius trueperi TaxID=759412 RepID=A0A226BZ46_9FIRM|nr:hypothetical protein CDO51_03380 [Natranaerobius trueperi]